MKVTVESIKDKEIPFDIPDRTILVDIKYNKYIYLYRKIGKKHFFSSLNTETFGDATEMVSMTGYEVFKGKITIEN